MKKDVYEFIINELKAYKMNKATLETIKNECLLGISAQQISDMPRNVTNKFSSMTENQAFNMQAYNELEKDIKRVEIWLNCLHDEERHMIEGFYIHDRTYNTIIQQWKTFYSKEFWKKKKVSGLNKIYCLIDCSFNERLSL